MNSLNDFKKNAKEILEAVPDIYLILDKNLSIVGVSNSYLQIMHDERENIVGNCIFELFTNDPNTDNTQLLKGLALHQLRGHFNQLSIN
jgi:PAS domain-containing protein